MIDKNIGYGYNDLTLLPTTFSDVKSRSEIYPFTYLEKLPIFASPMSTVVDLKNYNTYNDNKITPILPRNININERLQAARDGKWIAMSLNEFESYLINDNTLLIQNNNYRILRICVDIANGHMSYLYELCKKAKEKSVKEDYTLYIMTGNIADPMTYRELCLMNIEGKNNNNIPVVDYIRVGIGSGAGCFVDGTKIKTDKGEKNIEDININDNVLTIDGTYKRVYSTIRYKTNELLNINNEITCTTNHKFFVINKTDKELVTEENLEKIGFWIEAKNLDKEKHLLIKLE